MTEAERVMNNISAYSKYVREAIERIEKTISSGVALDHSDLTRFKYLSDMLHAEVEKLIPTPPAEPVQEVTRQCDSDAQEVIDTLMQDELENGNIQENDLAGPKTKYRFYKNYTETLRQSDYVEIELFDCVVDNGADGRMLEIIRARLEEADGREILMENPTVEDSDYDVDDYSLMKAPAE